MTYKILVDKSNKITCRSNIRHANIPLKKNICIEPTNVPTVIKPKANLENNTETENSSDSKYFSPILNSSDLRRELFSYLLIRLDNVFKQE